MNVQTKLLILIVRMLMNGVLAIRPELRQEAEILIREAEGH